MHDLPQDHNKPARGFGDQQQPSHYGVIYGTFFWWSAVGLMLGMLAGTVLGMIWVKQDIYDLQLDMRDAKAFKRTATSQLGQLRSTLLLLDKPESEPK